MSTISLNRIVKIALCSMVIALAACRRGEDAPLPGYPHVAGQWQGTGTDDLIGFYNITVTLSQSGGTASGDYYTSSGYTTTHGTIYLTFGLESAGNLQHLTMTDSNGTVRTLNAPNTITDNAVSFFYSGGGGMNLHKIAGTN